MCVIYFYGREAFQTPINHIISFNIKKMQQSKINIEPMILDAISSSTILSTSEKINFLKYVGYLTISEKKELVELI